MSNFGQRYNINLTESLILRFEQISRLAILLKRIGKLKFYLLDIERSYCQRYSVNLTVRYVRGVILTNMFDL